VRALRATAPRTFEGATVAGAAGVVVGAGAIAGSAGALGACALFVAIVAAGPAAVWALQPAERARTGPWEEGVALGFGGRSLYP